MNVFVLCTGRCGSTTMARACEHMSNFSAAHESRCDRLGEARLAYPDRHIEVDNRLAWFLGRLEEAYGDNAVYVHLQRDVAAVAASYAKRHSKGIMRAYQGQGIVMGLPTTTAALDVAMDYCNAVNSNIRAFLRDKSQVLEVHVENFEADFVAFWNAIGAEGDLAAARDELLQRHNAS